MVVKDLQHITYKRYGFSVNEFFLAEKAVTNAGINYCIQCPVNIDNSLSEFYTLLIDLSQTVEEIRAGIYHRTVSEIRSFTANQPFEHKILFDLSDSELQDFIRLFNTFAAEKKIRKAEAYRLKAYNTHGILAISYIRQNGVFICINFYRVTKERASNISSFIVRGNPASLINNTQLGRAHRALHWLDLLAFKKAGVRYYDFCGWYAGESDRELLNINKFKEQFTQHKVKEYNGVIYKNPLLLFLLKLRK